MQQTSQLTFRVRVAAVMVVALVAGLFSAPGAGAVVIEVTPDAMGNWSFSNFDASTSLSSADPTTSGTHQEFVFGPGTPPAGVASIRQVIGTDGDDGARLRTSDFDGTALSALTDVSYSTYVTSNSGGQASYMQLFVDTTGDGAWDDILFFEPVYQSGGYAGDVVPDQCPGIPNCVDLGSWQTWDVDAGGFWSLNAGTFGPPLTTLANYEAANPGAALATDVPAVRLTSGFGAAAWSNFDGNVDNLTVNGDTVDFDLGTPPPAVHIEDGGDGLVIQSEVGGVIVSGTYDLAASITSIDVSVHPDATCTAPGSATLPATLNVDGTYSAGPFDLSDAGIFPDGSTLCAQAVATDAGAGTSLPALSDNNPVIDISGPDVFFEVDDADLIIRAAEADAGVGVSYFVDGPGPAADMTVANTGDAAPAACTFAGIDRGPSITSVPSACFDALNDGPITFSLTGADSIGNVTTATVDANLDALLSLEVLDDVAIPAQQLNNGGSRPDTANAIETENGTALKVRLDFPSLADEVVQASVTVEDLNGDSVTVGPVEMAGSSSDATRTVALDVTSLAQGDLTVSAEIVRAAAPTSTAVGSTTLDTVAPAANWTTADGEAFVRINALFFFINSGALEGESSDVTTPVQWVHVRGRNLSSDTTFSRPAHISNRSAPSVTWELPINHMDPGEWEVTFTSSDEAGNITAPQTIVVTVDGTPI